MCPNWLKPGNNSCREIWRGFSLLQKNRAGTKKVAPSALREELGRIKAVCDVGDEQISVRGAGELRMGFRSIDERARAVGFRRAISHQWPAPWAGERWSRPHADLGCSETVARDVDQRFLLCAPMERALGARILNDEVRPAGTKVRRRTPAAGIPCPPLGSGGIAPGVAPKARHPRPASVGHAERGGQPQDTAALSMCLARLRKQSERCLRAPEESAHQTQQA